MPCVFILNKKKLYSQPNNISLKLKIRTHLKYAKDSHDTAFGLSK